jgi:hypothetical protein
MRHSRQTTDKATIYEIKIKGRIEERWADWFSGMAIAYDHNITTLTGPVPDQAALRGMLIKIWDLNLVLLSVNLVDSGQ